MKKEPNFLYLQDVTVEWAPIFEADEYTKRYTLAFNTEDEESIALLSQHGIKKRESALYPDGAYIAKSPNKPTITPIEVDAFFGDYEDIAKCLNVMDQCGFSKMRALKGATVDVIVFPVEWEAEGRSGTMLALREIRVDPRELRRCVEEYREDYQ